jgi:bifunctional DNase/RNase
MTANNTFELCRCILHPDTRREDLHDTMLRVFDNMDQNVRKFMQEQNVQGIFTSAVVGYDGDPTKPNKQDPVCALFLTIPDDAKAIYFKMWFETK